MERDHTGSIPASDADGTRVPTFRYRELASRTPLAFLEAFTACTSGGLTLCSEQQWERACRFEGSLAAHSTFVCAVDENSTAGPMLVTRGGGGCEVRTTLQGRSLNRQSGTLCCERVISSDRADPGLEIVREFETLPRVPDQADLLRRVLAPKIGHLYANLHDVDREQAIAAILGYPGAPQRASLHDACLVRHDAESTLIGCKHYLISDTKLSVFHSDYELHDGLIWSAIDRKPIVEVLLR